MALMYSQINIEHREILLKDKPLSMLQYSAKGTVPVLIVADKVIDESLDAMLWALSQNDPKNWMLGDDKVLQQDMMSLIETCDRKFKPQLDQYKYSDRHELSEEYYRDQTLWFLSSLNERLKQHKYLQTDAVSLADIAIFPFIRQLAFVNKQWFDKNEYTSLQKWLEVFIKSTLFQAIMPKYPLWSDN